MGPVSASIDMKICQEFHRLLVKIHYQGLWLPSPRDITGLCDLTDWTWVPPIARDSLGSTVQPLSAPPLAREVGCPGISRAQQAPRRPPAGPGRPP